MVERKTEVPSKRGWGEDCIKHRKLVRKSIAHILGNSPRKFGKFYYYTVRKERITTKTQTKTKHLRVWEYNALVTRSKHQRNTHTHTHTYTIKINDYDNTKMILNSKMNNSKWTKRNIKTGTLNIQNKNKPHFK